MAPLPVTLALLEPPPFGLATELATMSELFDELLLCTDRAADHLALEIALVSPLGPPPLGAIIAALLVARHESVVVAERPASHLVALAQPKCDVVLAAHEQLAPGCYRRSCLRRIERALKADQSATAALRGLAVEVVG